MAAAPGKRPPPVGPARAPDALIITGEEGRIRLIEKRKPRRKPVGKTARR
jgi:hypothetical protein